MLITIVLSRLLGLEEFGRYAWLSSLAFLLAGLSQAGGSSLVVRETARCVGRNAPVSILLRAALVSAIALVLLTAAISVILNDQATLWQLLPVLLLAVVHVAVVLVGASSRGVGLIQKGQVVELVFRPTLFLVVLGFIALWGASASAETIIYWHITVFGAAAMVATYLLYRGLSIRPKVAEESLNAGWLGSFLRLGLVGWLAVGNAQLLFILTGALSGFAEVGLYRVAVQAVLLVSLGLAAIETVQAPEFAKAYNDQDHQRLHALLQKSCRISFAFSLAGLGFLLILGRPALEMLFGQTFIDAFPSLCVLAVAQVFNAVTGNVGVLMIAAKQERKLILGNSAALLSTLLSAILFIPEHGAIAAAVAGGVGLTIRNALNMWFCWRSCGILALPFAKYPNGMASQEAK